MLAQTLEPVYRRGAEEEWDAVEVVEVHEPDDARRVRPSGGNRTVTRSGASVAQSLRGVVHSFPSLILPDGCGTTVTNV
jgi:hypothetical protein